MDAGLTAAGTTGRIAPALDGLIACPECDLLMSRQVLGAGQQARCSRCHHPLYRPRPEAAVKIVALALTAGILMVGALFFPFLSISAAGETHESSIFSTALAYSEGYLAPLAVAVMLLIVLLPVFRVGALIFAFGPLLAGRTPYRHAQIAFRLARHLRPWAMAEVFMIGTIVSLVKIGGLASVSFGPAFWAFAALVLAVGVMDNLSNDWTIWDALETTR
ncbi:paraquat-inducible protein A [Acidimangrovimonas sediminis]|uniref:paraquat-inducible protein A n=1 Tax=Acidimangrovimonas sediminis TaxID=2056283 RepID=UPI000C802CB0|nr:paraquat-inducible protein A [Acidimangrovimonas sediminis]